MWTKYGSGSGTTTQTSAHYVPYFPSNQVWSKAGILRQFGQRGVGGGGGGPPGGGGGSSRRFRKRGRHHVKSRRKIGKRMRYRKRRQRRFRKRIEQIQMKLQNYKSLYYKGSQRWDNVIDKTSTFAMGLGYGGISLVGPGLTGNKGDIYHGLNSLFGLSAENFGKVMILRNKLTFVIKNNSNFAAYVKVYKIKPKKDFIPTVSTRNMLQDWINTRYLAAGTNVQYVLHDWDVRQDQGFHEWYKVMKTKMYKWMPGETKVFTLKMPKLKRPLRADYLMSGQFKSWLSRELWFQVTGFPVHEGESSARIIGPAPVFFDVMTSWQFKASVIDQDFQKSLGITHEGNTFTTSGEGQQIQSGQQTTTTTV